MRCVTVNTEQAQVHAILYRTRALRVRQRTQTVNALRGHLTDCDLVAARGVANVEHLWQAFGGCAKSLPELVLPTARLLFDRVAVLTARIGEFDKQMQCLVREQDDPWRLVTIPGVREVSAMAVHAFAPPMEIFARGRDFAAWTALTPRKVSTDGRQQLGETTKMGLRDLRLLTTTVSVVAFHEWTPGGNRPQPSMETKQLHTRFRGQAVEMRGGPPDGVTARAGSP